MLSIFEAGIVAAYRQCIAIMAATLVVWFVARSDVGLSMLASDSDAFRSPASQFLGLTYLITAVGLALISDRTLGLTAERISRVSRLTRFLLPEPASRVLAFQCGLATVTCVVLMLRAPPELFEVDRYFGCVGAGSIGWKGIMSLGVAYFAANTHAALKAR